MQYTGIVSKEKTKDLIFLHLAVFLFGFSALFGRFILLSPVVIVFGRTFVAMIMSLILLKFLKQPIKLKGKHDYFLLCFNGVFFALHWFTFFKSIQVSNIAIAVLTFSTYPVFVTFLEPYFYKEKIRIFDMVTSFIALFGVFLILPRVELSDNLTQGALWGLAAGLTCAFLGIASKKGIEKHSALVIPFYQNLTAAIVAFPFVLYMKPLLEVRDVLLLILLGSLFTAVSGTLYVKSLSTMKVQFASIVTCLEPVYAIIFAAILLDEIPSVRTLIGGTVILGAILLATVKSRHKELILPVN